MWMSLMGAQTRGSRKSKFRAAVVWRIWRVCKQNELAKG
jgi:hypothetical protein